MELPEPTSSSPPVPDDEPAAERPPRSETLEAELAALEAMLPPEAEPPAVTKPVPGEEAPELA